MEDNFKYLPEKYRGEYQQVESIKSSNFAYFNTNYKSTQFGDKWKFKFRCYIDRAHDSLMGSNKTRNGQFTYWQKNNFFRFFVGRNDDYVFSVSYFRKDLEIHTFEKNHYETRLDNAVRIASSTLSTAIDKSFLLFGKGYCYIYSCQIHNPDNQLIIDYIPVIRKSDNVAGMLNIAPYAHLVDGEDVFHPSETETPFIAGAVVALHKLPPTYFMELEAAIVKKNGL